MYLCYIDESGTSSIPGNTSHFILAGIAIPIDKWKSCETDIRKIKDRYGLQGKEIHTGWILRKYLEQDKITDFASLDKIERVTMVMQSRKKELYRIQREKPSCFKQIRKNQRNTNDYVHLTWNERKNLIEEIADCISSWGFARIFAECVDKTFFDPTRTSQTVSEQAFEQVVSRFENFLRNISSSGEKIYGLIIHDNNETIAKRHTQLMKKFHKSGTFWTQIDNIIETPLFVNSELTSMIQIADVCAYAFRRYLENDESNLFEKIFERADRKKNKVVGVRHFTNKECNCSICQNHSNN